MNTATLTSKGQITIPRSIRRQFSLSVNQKVLFLPKKESVELVPVRGNLLDLYGVFHAKKAKRVKDWSKVRVAVRKHWVTKRMKGD